MSTSFERGQLAMQMWSFVYILRLINNFWISLEGTFENFNLWELDFDELGRKKYWRTSYWGIYIYLSRVTTAILFILILNAFGF